MKGSFTHIQQAACLQGSLEIRANQMVSVEWVSKTSIECANLNYFIR